MSVSYEVETFTEMVQRVLKTRRRLARSCQIESFEQGDVVLIGQVFYKFLSVEDQLVSVERLSTNELFNFQLSRFEEKGLKV